MKRHITTFLLATAVFFFATQALQAQLIGGVNYWVEKETVFLPTSENLSKDNVTSSGRNVTVYGSAAGNISAIETALEDFFNASSTTVRIDSLTNTLNDPNLFSEWEVIPVAPVHLDNFDWIKSEVIQQAAHFPFLFVSTQPISELDVDSYIGLVYSSSSIPDAIMTVGFKNEGANWDNALIGDLNSLTLAAIPEPRVYAALFGVFALGFVLWLRRRA